MNVTYVGALIAGLLSFLRPCVLPLVPPYLCFLGGTTFDQLTGEDETPSHVYTTVVLSSVAFVLGFTTVFVILGATATVAGQLLAANLPLLSKIAGVIIIIAGLHFLGRDPFADPAPRGALPRRCAARRPDRRLCDRPCLRLRLDAVHRAGARRPSSPLPRARTRCARASACSWSIRSGSAFPSFSLRSPSSRSCAPCSGFAAHLAAVEKVMGGFLVLTGILFLTNSMTLIAAWMLELFPGLASIG